MMDLFSKFAGELERSWAAAGHQVCRFPLLAAEALRNWDLPRRIDSTKLARWVCDGRPLPPQTTLDRSFGQPPVTLFASDRFFVEALFWHTATTGIHEHAFCGAFQVLDGSSLHAPYRFLCEREIDTMLCIGRLEPEPVEVLKVGDIREIPGGTGLIHALFHLEEPTVSVVVRTPAFRMRELEYKPPGLAMDPAHRDARTTKVLHVLDMLDRTHHSEFGDCARAAIEHLDAVGAFHVLVRVHARGEDDLEATRDAVRRRYGTLGPLLLAAADEEQRRAVVRTRRRLVVDSDARFLLALLLNLADRESIFDAVTAYLGGVSPHEWIMRTLERLSRLGCIGLEFDEALTDLVRAGLETCGDESWKGRLGEIWGAQAVDAQREVVAEAQKRLRKSPFLGPLLRARSDHQKPILHE